jgi:peptide-methionine (S)-S-oxide reductase
MNPNTENSSKSNNIEEIILANGCFWCTEAVFKRVRGILSVEPGYSGGFVKDPSYDQVCTGETGHAEAIQIRYDSQIISLEKLLEIFWYTHDPTTLNRQGNDIGTQYRSAIFYQTAKQKDIATSVKENIEKMKVYSNPVVTEITPFKNFYPAEKYHKDYYDNNKDVPYCSYVIDPKVQKLLSKFEDNVKHEYVKV